VVYFFLQNLLFKTFVDFAFGKLHSASSSTRVIFVAKAIHVLNDKFCWKKLHRVFSGIFVLERGKCHNVHLATLVLSSEAVTRVGTLYVSTGFGQIWSILQHSIFEFFQKNMLRRFSEQFLPPICALKFVEMLLEGFSYALSIMVVNLNIFNKI
jgi:hypothetical protein